MARYKFYIVLYCIVLYCTRVFLYICGALTFDSRDVESSSLV